MPSRKSVRWARVYASNGQSNNMDSDPTTRRGFLATAATALVAASAGCSGGTSDPGDTTTTEDGGQPGGANPGTPREDPVNGSVEEPYVQVYQQTIDSVALVRVFSSLGRDGQGSAMVYDDEHLVTNEHVVEGARDVEVRFARDDWRSAAIVGTDVYSDLGVLRVDDLPEYATPLGLVESDPPIGTRVVALGNPFGFGGSVTAGIVSGVDRSLPGPNDFQIPDAVQTDAPVNPGNSGGPLVDLNGEAVGVISQGGGQNLGFAISAGLIERVVPSLIQNGDYDHSYMGVRLVGVNPTIAEANDLPEVNGVLIVSVVSDGPSEGVLQGSPDESQLRGRDVPVGGDVVVAMDGEPIPTQEALSTFLALETSPGDTIPVEVLRDGERTSVDLTLGNRPPA